MGILGMVGKGLIIGAVLGFIIAQSPLMSAVAIWFGEPIVQQIQYMSANIIWLIPLGVLLNLWTQAKQNPVLIGGICAGIGIFLWVFVNFLVVHV